MHLQVNGSVKKLLKGGRDIEDSLLATVIRDLKIIEVRNPFVKYVFPHCPLHLEGVRCFSRWELLALQFICY